MFSHFDRVSQVPQAPQITTPASAADVEMAMVKIRHFVRQQDRVSWQELYLVIEESSWNIMVWNALESNKERMDWLELKLGRSLH